MKKPLFDDELFYLNESGFMIFTADYLLKRGYCCGNGCKHCPYDYKAVQDQTKREKLLKAQRAENNDE